MVGDSIYNLMAIEKLETDKHDRPLNPPIILSARVVSNPFADIFPRELSVVRPDLYAAQKTAKDQQDRVAAAQAAKSQKKLAPRVNLLSFGDEVEETIHKVREPEPKKTIACPHDLLKDDPSLAYDVLPKFPELEAREAELAARKRLHNTDGQQEDTLGKRVLERAARDAQKIKAGKEKGVTVTVDAATGKKVLQVDHVEGAPSVRGSNSSTSSDSESSSSEIENEELREIREKQKDLYEKMRFDSLQFKQEKTGTYNITTKKAEEQEKTLLTAVELKRYKFMKLNGGRHSQEEVLGKLAAFQNKLRSKDTKEDTGSWMNSKLKFHIDSAKAYSLQENKARVDETRFNTEFQMLRDQPTTERDRSDGNPDQLSSL